MTYDFTSRICRKKTGSDKWEKMYAANPEVEEGILPLSTADMEFENAPEIYEGFTDFLKSKPILGYTSATEEVLEAVVNWQHTQHEWNIEKDWIVNTPGIVAAINAAIRVLSKQDDGIIIFRPVYFPFGAAIAENKRTEVNVPLVNDNGQYTIDFEAFEAAAAKPENKVLLFCSPHNPVGRVWTAEELEKLADIAQAHNLSIISDEIWYDIVEPGQKHTILHKVNSDLSDRVITCTSPSKTFNLAGTAASNIIISEPKLRAAFKEEMLATGNGAINIFGYEGMRIAYIEGQAWFSELLEVVSKHKKLVHDYFKENYPKIKAPISEGTYIQWLDFSEIDMTDQERKDFLNKHQFFTDDGLMFGQEGSGYERINVALPEVALREALDRLVKALTEEDKQK